MKSPVYTSQEIFYCYNSIIYKYYILYIYLYRLYSLLLYIFKIFQKNFKKTLYKSKKYVILKTRIILIIVLEVTK